MLDVMTLRVTFGVVALTVLLLFYVGPYRNTRSGYSRWWCLALTLYSATALLYLCDGTPLQVVTNPGGNATATLGSACVWAGARSLAYRRVPAWQLAAGPVVVLAASFLDDPVDDVWTGGEAFLVAMGVLIGLSSAELWGQRRDRRGPTPEGRRYEVALRAMAAVSALIAAYYLARAACFLAVGPDHSVFETYFGSAITTLLTTVLLVVVTFSMSTLSNEQNTSELRSRATRDALTGVLNRSEFMRLAEDVREGASGDASGPALLVADLDGFKALNDGFGHSAGDQALTAFADACRGAVGADDLVGRLGGDEFALVLADGRLAELVTTTISRGYRDGPDGMPAPTISFGIAPMDPAVSVKDTIIRADVALYRAKAAGRNRAIRYDEAG